MESNITNITVEELEYPLSNYQKAELLKLATENVLIEHIFNINEKINNETMRRIRVNLIKESCPEFYEKYKVLLG